jgi:hypothetical protein
MSNPIQDSKVELLLEGQTAATNSTSYGYLDTIGWQAAKVLVAFGTAATTSAVATTLSLTEGTNSTAASAVVALTGGTATDSSHGFVIPTGVTTEGVVVAFDVDLRKRSRYLRLNVTPAQANSFAAMALLTRGNVEPGSDDGSVPSGAHVIA